MSDNEIREQTPTDHGVEKNTGEQPGAAEVQAIADQAPRPDDYTPGQGEELRQEIPGEPNVVDESVAEALSVTEDIAANNPVVQGFDAAVTSLQESIESLGSAPDHPVEAMADTTHDDTVVLFGREIPVPLYTAVFLGLGALTLIEVVISIIITAEWLRIPLLLAIALGKAALVVLFYMHLRSDSRVFTVTLILPVMIALISMLYLLGVPPTGY